MARINIEDRILRDRRFFDMSVELKSQAAALGALYFAWNSAQYWYTRSPSRLIPLEEWKKLEHAELIIKHSFACEKDGGVYVCGSNEQFQWLAQRQEAGKRGALITNGKLGRQTSANVGKRRPSSSSSSSSSSSTSTSKNLKTYAQQVERLYLELYPRKIGKQKGITKLNRDLANEGEIPLLEKAIRNYAEHVKGSDHQFIKHFYTWAGEWRDWIDVVSEQEEDWLTKKKREYKINV